MTRRQIESKTIATYERIRGGREGWGIDVSKMKWENNMPTIDIRHTNNITGIIGKGVSLTDEEVNRMVDVLLENNYGSTEAIEAAIKRRKALTEFGDIIDVESNEVIE